jgi:hypothetical protein
LSKAKTSKPESSAMKAQVPPSFDKLYWLRLGLAAVAGLIAAALVGLDFTSGISLGIAMYLVSFYLARYTWYRRTGSEFIGKIYTTGVGSFILVFLFTWMLLFTLQTVGYSV